MSFSQKQDPRVEKLISEAIAGIAAAFAASPESSSVRAVVLGGGYGRGEGGATPDGMPYNDLDFFVVMKGARATAGLRKLLDSISAEWGAKLAIDVDFCCVDSVRALCKDASTLMIQELFAGGNVIFGDCDVFDGVPVRPFSEIPWTEGARLLLNRGAGLLFARQRRDDPAQADFVRRNIHKAALGCGDAILVVHHDYRRTGTERLEALRKYHEASWLVPAYQAALEFKYNPAPGPAPDWDHMLDCWLRTVTLAAVEITGKIASADALFSADEIADSAPRSLKSLLLSLHSAHQWSGLLSPLAVHPRVKLLRLLAECLLDPSRPDGAFMKLWARYN
ncbi:MAG: hypothetical protein PUC15_01780 [Lentisphaeria bacterium]|nr:hypothetical protein [Lentisphaeria bacterium]